MVLAYEEGEQEARNAATASLTKAGPAVTAAKVTKTKTTSESKFNASQ